MTIDESRRADAPVEAGDDGDTSGRRKLLKAGALAAMVGVAGGAASSRTAAAADNDPVLIGKDNEGTGETHLVAGGFSSYGPDNYLGLYGDSLGEDGTGVIGYSDDGYGVFGVSDFIGVVGSGAAADFVAGRSGRIGFNRVGALTPTSPGVIGTLAVTTDGTIWYCYATNRWMELGGPKGSGAFHAINPVRAYDSRVPQPLPGKLRNGQSRLVSVADGRNPTTGAVIAKDAVPVGATAVTFNLTIVETEVPGFLAVAPGSATSATTSTINWPSPNYGAIANASVSALDGNRRVRVFCVGGPTHFIVDITGYYR